jgi:hypothetical protein
MENKQEIEKEYEKSKIENELEIKNLIHQEILAKAELNKVALLNEKDNKVIRELKKNFSEFGTNSEVSLMVNDLYSVAILEEDGYNPKNKNIKKKKDFDLIEEIILKLKVNYFYLYYKFYGFYLFDFFKQFEFTVNKYIDDLDYISKTDEAKFRGIVNSRKEDNKKKKQQSQKIKTEGGWFFFNFSF